MSIYDEASVIFGRDANDRALVIDHNFRSISIPKGKRLPVLRAMMMSIMLRSPVLVIMEIPI